MKVICIDSGSYHLTVNKIYEVENYYLWISLNGTTQNSNGLDYYITNDIGYRHTVESTLFTTVPIIREQKLKQLGIEEDNMKEIILNILKQNTETEHIYTGGGHEPAVIKFIDSEDCDVDKYLSQISEQITEALRQSYSSVTKY